MFHKSLSKTEPRKEALNQIYDTSYSSIMGHFIVLLSVIYLYLDFVPTHILLIYFFIHIIFLSFRFVVVSLYFKKKRFITSNIQLRKWSLLYGLSVFLTACAWGYAFILFQYGAPIEYHIFMVVVLVGLGASSIITLGSIVYLSMIFITPMFLIFSLWLLSQDEKLYTVISILMIFSNIFLYFSAKRYSIYFDNSFQEKNNALNAQFELIQRLSKASELKDNETGMHITRICHYVYILALECGEDEPSAKSMSHASSMHDVGKIGIADSILLKPGKLDADEWEIMQSHTLIGKSLLSGSTSELIQLSESIAYTHHEKYDGSGYPMRLQGKDIPIEGRIVAICDVFDALVLKRPYKEAWSYEKAFTLIEEESGKHFDPKIVKHFMNLKSEIIALKEKYDD